MDLHLSRDRPQYLRAHVDELTNRASALLFLLSLATVLWWVVIDSVIETWLNNLPLGIAHGTISVYDPHGWMSTRWSMISLLALVTTLPFAAHQLIRFTDRGLLPSERKWLRIVTIGGTSFALFCSYYWWVWGYPLAIENLGYAGNISGIGARYDAVQLFDVGIGVSWWLFLVIISTIGLTVARLLSMALIEPLDPFRIRIHGTVLLVWWLACPTVMTNIWPFAALSLVILPEFILLFSPSLSLTTSGRSPSSVFDSEGKIHRKAIALCGCEGACPSIPSESLNPHLGCVKSQALCLDADARDTLLDYVIRNQATQLLISGCDGTPLPVDFRQSIKAASCELSGMNWLDNDTKESDRIEMVNRSITSLNK
ncbi:MAG: hypothetical protein CMB37_03990 [Euryarchaeota archaeon]|nr:hypothetical protein [Euryarchaeota archaeon]